MHAVDRGWKVVGKSVRFAIKLWASSRLDLAISISCQALVPHPPGLGVALSHVARLLVAAKVARGGGGGGGGEATASQGSNGSRTSGGTSKGPLELGAAAPTTGSPRRGLQPPAPKGLNGSSLARPRPPAVLLPAIPPGALACCSTQPIGLPMMLVGQSAARAPMHALRGDRLVRGLAGLAAAFLFCRCTRTPFTGRLARLPPRIVEFFFHSVVGPAAAMSYLSTSTVGQAAGPGDRALCQQYKPALQQMYMQLRGAGEAEARRGGRSIVFASGGPSVDAIQRPDVNACCLPGGIVFVHSGLIKAVQGRQDSLAFVLGHEVGHAIGRHSLEKATSMYAGMFAADVVVGLAERILLSLSPPGREEEHAAAVGGHLKTLEGLLQSGLYLMQLSQSRRHEYEADQLALQLGAGAGINRRSLFEGATDVLRRFMHMEADKGGPLAPAAAQQGDSPLSTHPAAANRLRRLSALFSRT